jgi:hypothetical protein
MISIEVEGIKAVRNSDDDDTHGRHRNDGDRLFARQGACVGGDVSMQSFRAAEPAPQLIDVATFDRAGDEIASHRARTPPQRHAADAGGAKARTSRAALRPRLCRLRRATPWRSRRRGNRADHGLRSRRGITDSTVSFPSHAEDYSAPPYRPSFQNHRAIPHSTANYVSAILRCIR